MNERRTSDRLTSRWLIEHFLVAVWSLHSKRDRRLPVWALFSLFLPVSSNVDRDRLNNPFSTCVSPDGRSNRSEHLSALLIHRPYRIEVHPSTVGTVSVNASTGANVCRELSSALRFDHLGWRAVVERWPDDRSKWEFSSWEIPRPAGMTTDHREQAAKKHVSCVTTWMNDED